MYRKHALATDHSSKAALCFNMGNVSGSWKGHNPPLNSSACMSSLVLWDIIPSGSAALFPAYSGRLLLLEEVMTTVWSKGLCSQRPLPSACTWSGSMLGLVYKIPGFLQLCGPTFAHSEEWSHVKFMSVHLFRCICPVCTASWVFALLQQEPGGKERNREKKENVVSSLIDRGITSYSNIRW